MRFLRSCKVGFALLYLLALGGIALITIGTGFLEIAAPLRFGILAAGALIAAFAVAKLTRWWD
jgi:hypothetical protein